MSDRDGEKNDKEVKSSFDDIESRLDGLGDKLDKIKADNNDSAKVTRSIADSHSQMGKAFQITSELVGPVLVGGFIGYWLDKYFETKPVLLIILLLLGAAAGFLNVFRAAKKMQDEAIASGAYKNAKDVPFDDDDE